MPIDQADALGGVTVFCAIAGLVDIAGGPPCWRRERKSKAKTYMARRGNASDG